MLTKICKLARIAGRSIMKFYYTNKKINFVYKIDQSPITNADKISHQIIKSGLTDISPNIPILSEEDSKTYCKSWNIYWLVDPLDGTKEFLKKNGEFTVNISLIEYGKPVLGVIYAPFFNILYYAFNQQAWKIDEKGYKKEISVVHSKQPLFVISRSHLNSKLNIFLEKIKFYKLKELGSSLKFCYVADGQAQFYPRFGNTYIWDTAAGHAIVNAAGGSVKIYGTNIDLDYSLSTRKSLINPYFLVSS
ncbi:3'(2'),5'-bisphosphate nucleotidase CysQ [Buchnera aphidicola (Protaphis terricola)]|uniref:3'(2'),5'-bisphosphate nucleotidase CysQ n=1 Tax=Buchnera aphidicola TaxID=9 RepID=UPI0034642450